MIGFVVQGHILHVSYRAGVVQIIWDTDNIIWNHTEKYKQKDIYMSLKSGIEYNKTHKELLTIYLITCNTVFIELSSSNRVAYNNTL